MCGHSGTDLLDQYYNYLILWPKLFSNTLFWLMLPAQAAIGLGVSHAS